MLVSGIFGLKNISRLKAVVEFPEEIFARTEFPVLVRVTNPRRFMPVFLVTVTVDGVKAFFPYIERQSTASAHVTLDAGERGTRRLTPVVIASVFPFNFFTRFRTLPGETTYTVFPHPRPCPWISPNNRRTRAQGDTSSSAAGFESEVFSIRDYATGDPTKYICWKSTAKTDALKTKEMSSIDAPHVMIDFNRMDLRDMEAALSCAAFLVLKGIKAGTPIGLVIEGDTFPPASSPAHKVRLLTRLALHGKEENEDVDHSL